MHIPTCQDRLTGGSRLKLVRVNLSVSGTRPRVNMDLNASRLKTKPRKPVNLTFISVTTELIDDPEQPGRAKTSPRQESNEANGRKIIQRPLCPVHHPL